MERAVAIPEGIDVKFEKNTLVIKGSKGELRREFKNLEIKTKAESGGIIFSSESERRKITALLGTWAALTKNMINGVRYGWVCKLRLVYSHFPVKLKVEDGKVIIHNFLGERRPRIAMLLPGTEARIEKDEVVITGIDKEKVGQSCANIEQTCSVKGYDRRIFQDGIWILGKPELDRG